MATTNPKFCSEIDCFTMIDLDLAEKNADGSYYPPSLKCWDCRTKNDRRNIKAKRNKNNRAEKSN